MATLLVVSFPTILGRAENTSRSTATVMNSDTYKTFQPVSNPFHALTTIRSSLACPFHPHPSEQWQKLTCRFQAYLLLFFHSLPRRWLQQQLKEILVKQKVWGFCSHTTRGSFPKGNLTLPVPLWLPFPMLQWTQTRQRHDHCFMQIHSKGLIICFLDLCIKRSWNE